MSVSQEECPGIQTIMGKEDLGNQLATAGEAVEVINLFSSNTEKGISFVLNWPKKNAFKHSHGNSLQMASVLMVVNLSPVAQVGEARVCSCLSEGTSLAEVLTGKRKKGE